MSRIAVTFACWLLKLPLDISQRTRLVGAILDRLNAVPFDDVIIFREDGKLIVDGREVEYDKAIKLRESAMAMRNNQARRLVQDQIVATAGTRGVVEGDTPEKLYFYRAALWFARAEQEIYDKLVDMNASE